MFLPNFIYISVKCLQFPNVIFRRAHSVSKNVRVRFAPSPTGNLHLGGLRTALLNYLFAKKCDGTFILRIEDTDRKRVKPGSLENIQNVLSWTSLHPDEGPGVGGPKGPYIQSERVGLYKEKAEELLKIGAAYRCFCSETRLELLRKEAYKNRQNPGYDNKCRHLTQVEIDEHLAKGHPYTVRFKLINGPLSFNDIVFGEHTFNISEFEGDFIILKSDGFPTYHFSCVVDDHCMDISHVLRGAEWLASTAKHFMLHNAFGWHPPAFAHLPLLVNSDRTKLSKRQLAVGVDQLKDKGFEPLAILNFLAGIGTGLHKGCEVVELEELAQNFDITRVNTASCALELQKLDLYNNLYLAKQLSTEIYTDSLVDQFKTMLKTKFGEWDKNMEKQISDEYIKKILHCYKGRISRLSELLEPEMQYLWTLPDKNAIQTQLQELRISESLALDVVSRVEKGVQSVVEEQFEMKKLSEILSKCVGSEKEKYTNGMRMLRVVLTGQKNGPGVGEILSMLGKERSLRKLDLASKILQELNVVESQNSKSVQSN